MITDEDYIDFQKWWKDTIKKPNTVPPNDKIELPEKNQIFIKIPDEYKSNFPGVIYRQTKQAGALKLYGKKHDGSLKELGEHELCDFNRNSKQKQEYRYNENEWFIDDRNTVMQNINKSLGYEPVLNSIKDSSTVDTSQIQNYLDNIDDNFIEKIIKHPRLNNYIDSKIKQSEINIINTLKNQLSCIPKQLFGMHRVVLRDAMLCAWKNKLTNREHNDDKKHIYYIPIEVFSDKSFRFHPRHMKDPTLSLKNAKNYAVCQRCHDSMEENTNKFFNSKARADVCGICKNRQTSNKRVSTGIPICVGCSNSSNAGALDKDWDKGLLKQTFEVVVQQFPDLKIEIHPEKVIPSPKDLGQGNHNKRIDLLIVFNTIKTVRGTNREGKVAILIELDDQQKSNMNAEETLHDIKNTIKEKVNYVNNDIKPDILTIWKVNYNTDYYTPTELVRGFSFYNRMVILRQYIYVMIYHWFELPKQFVLYFWYNHNKIKDITNNWTQNDDERKYISFIWYAPHDPSHYWHYCVDPCEGGCEYFERMSSFSNTDELEVSEITENSQNQVRTKQQSNPDKNPYNKIIVNNRKILKEIFNFDFPLKDNNFTFSIFRE
jgi:uncharacterized CHY-type Zn-finger protein